MYWSHSISGHSLQRPPHLVWPHIYVNATVNPVLPLTKGCLSNVASISWSIRVLLEGKYPELYFRLEHMQTC